MTAQESYFANNNNYATLAQLTAGDGLNISRDVSLVIADESATGWSATATHPALVGFVACGVFVGTAAPPNAATSTGGEVACW